VAKPLEGDRHESLIVEFVSVNDDDMRFWNDAHRAELARHRSAGSRIDGTPPLTPRRLSGLSDTEPGICDVLYSGWGRVSMTQRSPAEKRWASCSVEISPGFVSAVESGWETAAEEGADGFPRKWRRHARMRRRSASETGSLRSDAGFDQLREPEGGDAGCGEQQGERPLCDAERVEDMHGAALAKGV